MGLRPPSPPAPRNGTFVPTPHPGATARSNSCGLVIGIQSRGGGAGAPLELSAGLWGRERGPKGPRKGQAAAATLPALPGLARRPNAQPGKGKQNPEEDGPGLLFGPSKAPFQRGDPFGTLDWDRIQMAPKPPSVRLSSSSIPPTRDHGWGGRAADGKNRLKKDSQARRRTIPPPPPPTRHPELVFAKSAGRTRDCRNVLEPALLFRDPKHSPAGERAVPSRLALPGQVGWSWKQLTTRRDPTAWLGAKAPRTLLEQAKATR